MEPGAPGTTMGPDPCSSVQTEGPPIPETDIRSLVLLAGCGAVLILVCCYWNLIALGGPLGIADRWVVDLARPASALHEALLGPLETDPEGLPQVHRIAQLVGSWLIATVAYFGGVLLVLNRPGRVGVRGLDLIVAVSILCRVIPVFSPPILETDPCRYLWDGASVANGINPYRHAPLLVRGFKAGLYRPGGTEAEELTVLARLVDHPRLNWHFMHINHPDVPTVYPPLAQALFSLTHRISPGNVLVEKALIALVDVGVIVLLLTLLPLVGQPKCLILVYGWCPMVLKEYAQTGHYDPIATLCLIGSLYLLIRGRRILGGIYLGLAVLGKIFPIIVLPVLVRRFGVRGVLACLATIVLFWAPFLDIGLEAFEGLRAYNRGWVMNSSMFPILREVIAPATGSDPARLVLETKAMTALIMLPILGWLTFRPDVSPRQIVGKAFAAVALLFLLSPVGNPWYCGWLIPFAALFGRISWVVLSSNMVGYYAFWTFQSYTVQAPGLPWPVDLRLPEYLPFYLLLIAEEWTHRVRS